MGIIGTINKRDCLKFGREMMKDLASKYNFTNVNKSVQFLIFLTVFVNTYIFFSQPFEGHLYYLVFLGMLPLFVMRFGLPQNVIVILIALGVVGWINVAIGSNSSFSFIKIWGGFILNLMFYYYVLRYYNFNLTQLFAIYLKVSFFIALIGFVQVAAKIVGFGPGYNFQWLFNKWGSIEGGFVGVRVNSIYSEPATLGTSMAPAAYVAINNLLHKKEFVLTKLQSAAIAMVYLLSASSVAFVGLLVIFFLVTDSIKLRYFLIGLGLSIGGGITLYQQSPEFRYRVDTSIALWVYQDYRIENTNSSSFVLYNNANVSYEAFLEAPLFGTGLGSYEQAFEKHTLTTKVLNYDFEFNTADGNSLFFRTVVETGLVGVFLILLVLFRGFIPKKDEIEELHVHRLISQGIFVMILLYLLRQGNYFLNGFFLFCLIYYFNWKQYTTKKLALEEKQKEEVKEAD